MDRFCKTTTSDALVLPGVHWTPSLESRDAVVFIHGYNGNVVEQEFAQRLGATLAERDIGFIYGHTRGHSATNSLRSLDGDDVRCGSQFERLGDAQKDVSAWMTHAREWGYKSVVLMGHGLGCTKIVGALGEEQIRPELHTPDFGAMRPSTENLVGLILASPIDIVTAARRAHGANYDRLVAAASEMTESGQGRQLLLGLDSTAAISAASFLDRLDGAAGDVLPVGRHPQHPGADSLGAVRVPVLAFYGSKEKDLVASPTEDLRFLEALAVGAPSFDSRVLSGADHLYRGCEESLAKAVAGWAGHTLALGAGSSRVLRDVAGR